MSRDGEAFIHVWDQAKVEFQTTSSLGEAKQNNHDMASDLLICSKGF